MLPVWFFSLSPEPTSPRYSLLLILRLQVVVTISRGRVVWVNEKLNVVKGAGRFVKLPLFPPMFEGIAARDAVWLAKAFPYGKTPVDRGAKTVRDLDEL